MLPPPLILDTWLKQWLEEDIGSGDRTTTGLSLPSNHLSKAQWVLKSDGVVAGLPLAQRLFALLDPHSQFTAIVDEGTWCPAETIIATIEGKTDALLTGERVALNLVMRLSGISTLTYTYAQRIADLSAQLVDTRKTTPGLRVLEKYAVSLGGGRNHRFGLDDAVMIKENHIHAAGSITKAVQHIQRHLPITTSIEVETESLEQVREALSLPIKIIMLDNMNIPMMEEAIALIRSYPSPPFIEASGNITLETIRSVAALGVDFISTSAMITRSCWLDISMRMIDR